MHFDFTVTLGQVVTLGIVLGALARIEWWFRRTWLEHEILIRWYAKENNIKLSDLPTRFKSNIEH